MKPSLTYVIVSPVRDEERFVEETFRSVLAQTVLPIRWVIVDDGSTDRTPEIVARYAAQHPWIVHHRLASKHGRDPAAPVARAFNAGFAQIKDLEFDVVVKLDCDVKLPPDYFERLFSRFEEDPTLGIASGIYVEETRNGWRPVKMPAYHASGASKVMRLACFEAIGGFLGVRGWDTLDEIRAQVLGWKTRHFDDLTFYHLKPEGSGAGFLTTNVMHGEIYYLTGGDVPFLALKVLHRTLTGTPRILGGAAMLYGFLRCWIRGRERFVTSVEAKHYNELLTNRLKTSLRNMLNRGSRRSRWGVRTDVRY